MTTKNIIEQIESLVQEQTFTAAALEGIQAIKKQLEETLKERDYLLRKTEADKQIIELNVSIVNDQKAEILALKAIIGRQEEAADKGRVAIFEAAKHQAVADAYKYALDVIFKPSTLRETVQRSVAVPLTGSGGGGGYGGSPGFVQQGNESETKTVEKL